MIKARQTASVAAVIGFTAAFTVGAMSQTAEDLKNDHLTPGDVLVYGMGYSAQRYSPLTQINKDNVAKLVPVWGLSLTDNRGAEGFPVVKDGVIYVTAHNATMAVDALTGRQIWRAQCTNIRRRPCGSFAAASSTAGRRSTTARSFARCSTISIVALDATTGKEVWRTKSPEPVAVENGYAMTGAPLIVNGVVIVGVAGAEFSHRGFLEGYDAETGKHLWRHYTFRPRASPDRKPGKAIPT